MSNMNRVWKALQWAASEAYEKINVAATWREIKGMGAKYGRRFVVAAVLWECVEDIVLPLLSWYLGAPQLIPLFLIFHFEPVVYPVLLWAFKTWDRYKGRAPWEPDRSAQSTNWRSMLKVLSYRLSSLGCFWVALHSLGLNLWIMTFYALMMAAFGFVHERIWHDSNYGIEQDDHVDHKRVVLKTLTYRGVSTLIMTTALYGMLGHIPWVAVWTYQGAMLCIQGWLEHFWSHNTYGIKPTCVEP